MKYPAYSYSIDPNYNLSSIVFPWPHGPHSTPFLYNGDWTAFYQVLPTGTPHLCKSKSNELLSVGGSPLAILYNVVLYRISDLGCNSQPTLGTFASMRSAKQLCKCPPHSSMESGHVCFFSERKKPVSELNNMEVNRTKRTLNGSRSCTTCFKGKHENTMGVEPGITCFRGKHAVIPFHHRHISTLV
jgi:hypothetical protein